MVVFVLVVFVALLLLRRLLLFLLLLSLRYNRQMENSILLVKGRKINIQMRITFSKLGFMHCSI